MPVQKIIANKCWIYSDRFECDKFRYRGEASACYGFGMAECSDLVHKNNRVKLAGPYLSWLEQRTHWKQRGSCIEYIKKLIYT